MQHNTFKPGEILLSIWGYEACMASFYKVIRITPKSVVVAEFRDHLKTGNWVEGTSEPIVNENLGTPMTKQVKLFSDGKPYIRINSNSYATRWNGKAVNTYNHH